MCGARRDDAMLTRAALADYLAGYLSIASVQDYSPNGLQVEGRAEIQRICTAVTASRAIILAAIAKQADALLVHHGFFWPGESPLVVGLKRARIAPLLQHDLNLFAYHLPLDCHHELGNNACIGRLLQITSMQQHLAGKTPGVLWSGELPQAMSLAAFKQRCQQVFQREPLVIDTEREVIKRVVWCSGAAQDFIELAAELGADVYLSGEVSERTYYQAKELGISYLACGHHATERFGIQALGQHLQQAFGLVHEFLDCDNPV